MFDAKSLLDGLLKATQSGSTQQRVEHAVGPQGLGGQGGLLEQLGGMLGGAGGQGGGLGGLLGQLTSGVGGQGGGAGGQGGGLGGLLGQLTSGAGGQVGGAGSQAGDAGGQGGGLGGLLGQLGGAGGKGGLLGGLAEAAQGAFNRTTESVKENNPAAVGGLGALAGALLGGRGGAIGGGLMAVLGSLAYSAMQNMDAGARTATPAAAPALLPPGLAPTTDPVEEARTNTAAMVVIRGMINAAKADGQIDQEEMRRIAGELQESGADAEAREFVVKEMRKPFDLDGLVASVDDREVAIQVYAATLLAIEIDTPAEEQYVRNLAARLGLDGSVVANIHRTLGIA